MERPPLAASAASAERLDVLQSQGCTGRSLWPYFAENFEALDAGFGMKVWHGVRRSRSTARECYSARRPRDRNSGNISQDAGPVFACTAGTGHRQQQAEPSARKDLLAEAHGIDGHIVGLLTSKKQDVRSGAAEWAAQRGIKDAIAPLRNS